MNYAFPIAVSALRILIVSATDSRYMPFLAGMLRSIESVLALPNVDFACFDIGLSAEDRAWLDRYSIATVQPGTHFGLEMDAHAPALRTFLARPFLQDYFPGYDIYMWVDSDIWFQDPSAVGTFISSAWQQGVAVAHESEPAYRFQATLLAWTSKHFVLGYGPVTAAYLLTRSHLNAGLFAIRAGAPHWLEWARRYKQAISRSGALVPHDQFSLNHAIYGDIGRSSQIPRPVFLDPSYNWICDRGIPMWDDEIGAFCKPRASHEAIKVLHLAGPGKWTVYDIKRSGGGSFSTYVLPGASPDTPITLLPTRETLGL